MACGSGVSVEDSSVFGLLVVEAAEFGLSISFGERG